MARSTSGRFSNHTPDYNLISPEDMDELLFSDYGLALGEETRERIRKQFENYEYYDGKQHFDEETGTLVHAKDLPRPPGLDYDPTRYATNYFKTVIDRKARWQMSGEHSVHVPRKRIDDEVDALEENYEPSEEQKREHEIADGYEELLQQLWKENKMRTNLLRAARDRLIADRVVCKIVFNQRTGKLRWIWRPDTEYIPIYSDDDFEELIGCYFVRQMVIEDGEDDIEAVRIQSFKLNEDQTECYLEEAIYATENLEVIEQITSESPMGIDFIPVVEVPVDELVAGVVGDGEVSHLREQNDILNAMNEDAIDSLKFEMFSMTALMNVAEGTAEKLQIAPGAVVEARNAYEGQAPDIKKIEGGFRWKEAFKDQYARVKGAMHEISGLPQVVPQELNFGGLNGEALRILFHDIISDTEEHWLTWQYALQDLHEKSVRYLQARLPEPNFAYDKDVVRAIEDYTNEINFVLPLPDNRKELVDLLGSEIMQDLESKKGAMERLGVDNVEAKMKEIEAEKIREQQLNDPYAGMSGEGGEEIPIEDDEEEIIIKDGRMLGGSRGDEPMITCPTCGGSGKMTSRATGDVIQCTECGGKGVVQERKR